VNQTHLLLCFEGHSARRRLYNILIPAITPEDGYQGEGRFRLPGIDPIPT